MVLFTLLLGACNTSGQPNYARDFQAKNQRAEVDERDFSLSSANPMDGALQIELLSINEKGELLLRTQFGIEKFRKFDRKLLNGQYIVLLDSDQATQEARLRTWAKPIL